MTDSAAVNCTGITMDQEAEINAFSCLVANILDAYPDKTPIYVKNQEGKYIGCSKGFLKLLGLTSDGVLGRTARELFPEQIAKEDEIGDKALQWVVGQENMEVAIDINGREHYLLFKKNGFCSGRGSLSGGVVGVITDITALKRRSVQKEMMDALASVSPGVYHDINNLLTPIGSVLSMIEGDIARQKITFNAEEDNIHDLKKAVLLLQKHLKDKLSCDELKDLPNIEYNITQIGNIFSQNQVNNIKYEKYLEVGIKALNQIKSILSQLSKLARVNLNSSVSEFNVNNIVVEATSMIFPGSNINKELLLCENPWPITLDYLSAFRILLNLVVNSVQAMPNGGNLTCKTENKIINGKRFVKFTVADTGGGIPLEVLNEIDQPHATTKTGGHGYGLCVVSSLIRDCGGEKEIKSHPGHGTEFEVLIPASKDLAIEIKDILNKCGNLSS